MSLCARCELRFEPERPPLPSLTCDFCGSSLVMLERNSGEQLHLNFLFSQRSPLNPKFKVKSGLIVKAGYDSKDD